MQNRYRLTIDSNEVTFEITDTPETMADMKNREIDPIGHRLVVTTKRDGKEVWSGIAFQAVTAGVPVNDQFTAAQLTEIYRRTRRRWYKNLLESPLLTG